MDEASTRELFGEEESGMEGIPEEGMLDRIREILLGHEKEALEQRFREFERLLLGQIEDHRRSTVRRFEKLEHSLQREIEELGGQLQVRSQDLSRRLDKDLADLGERLTREGRERGRALEGLEEKLGARQEELARGLDREVLEREQLGELLVERTRVSSEDLAGQIQELSSSLMTRWNREKEERTQELGDLRGEIEGQLAEARQLLSQLERRVLDRRALSELLLETAMRLTVTRGNERLRPGQEVAPE